MITIFTPTYNRKNTLPKLYESLKRQSSKDFQWVVVDDGSCDGTGELIKKWREEKNFEIIYEYQENSGKMSAINRGAKLAKGEFFFIVDSDDYITDDAVETIINEGKKLPKNMGGLIFRKVDISSGKVAGKPYPSYIVDSSPIEIVYHLGIIGDKAEVFRTKYIQENPFKLYEGEKFTPEASIWIKIGERYKMRYIDRGIYYFEYLPDGYTQNFNQLMRKNPKGFEEYYRGMLKYNIPLLNRIKFIIRLIQCRYFQVMGGKR